MCGMTVVEVKVVKSVNNNILKKSGVEIAPFKRCGLGKKIAIV